MSRPLKGPFRKAPSAAPPLPPRPQKVNPPGPHITDVGEYWRTLLPKPPANSQSDEEVGRWIDDVAYAGGVAALHWIRDAENWPKSLGSVMRSRLMHHVEKLHHEHTEAMRKASLRKVESQVEQQEAERREKQRMQGW
jgi:histidinol dehydrogenase